MYLLSLLIRSEVCVYFLGDTYQTSSSPNTQIDTRRLLKKKKHNIYLCGSKVHYKEAEINFQLGEGLRLLIQTLFSQQMAMTMCLQVFAYVLVLFGDFLVL